MSFQLTINIGGQDVTAISAAGQMVTLVRPVACLAETAGAGFIATRPVVAWQVIPPAQRIVVGWSAAVTPYASLSSTSAGSVVEPVSWAQQPAQPGSTATLSQGTFTYAQGPGTAYGVAADDALVVGLLASATVNQMPSGDVPICALPVLAGELASFTPSGAVSILLSSCTSNGTIIPSQADWCTVVLDSAQPTASVSFVSGTGTFQPS